MVGRPPQRPARAAKGLAPQQLFLAGLRASLKLPPWRTAASSAFAGVVTGVSETSVRVWSCQNRVKLSLQGALHRRLLDEMPSSTLLDFSATP